MIQFEGVTKRYGAREALSQLDMKIPRGTMAFITGHSGAGKSTLLKMVALLERPSNGCVLIEGRNLNQLKGSAVSELRRAIGLVFQDHHLLYDRNVFENVALPLHVAGYYPYEVSRKVMGALDLVGLADRSTDLPGSLSAGEQQRISIARAMVRHPEILLADEPTGNLDEHLSREIMRLFGRFNSAGTTVLVATHDSTLIQSLPYPQIQLHRGRIMSVDSQFC